MRPRKARRPRAKSSPRRRPPDRPSTGSSRGSSRKDCARRCARRARPSRRAPRTARAAEPRVAEPRVDASREPRAAAWRDRLTRRADAPAPGAADRDAQLGATADPAAPAFRRRHRRVAEALAGRAGRGDPDRADHPRPRRGRLLAARPDRGAGQRRARPGETGAEGFGAVAAENSRPGRPAGVRTGHRAALERSRAPARSRRWRSASCSTRKTRPTRRASATSARRSGAPRPSRPGPAPRPISRCAPISKFPSGASP